MSTIIKHNVVETDTWSNGDVVITKIQRYSQISFDAAGEVEQWGNVVEDDYVSNNQDLLDEILEDEDGEFIWPESLEDRGFESTHYSLEAA